MPKAVDPCDSPAPAVDDASVGLLSALFLAAAGAVFVFQAPDERLSRYLYNDSGASLVAPTLLDRGLRPGLDFGYIYGLLPLEASRPSLPDAWPPAFRLLTWAAVAGLGVGLTRLLAAVRAGIVGTGLALVALPDLLRPFGITPVQAIEPVLLVHALAFQARGRRGAALAVATADLFVKPAMAYVYGFFLVAGTAAGGRTGFARFLRPSAAVGAIFAAWLGIRYGVLPLITTLWPGAGAEVYRRNNYGFFFGEGRSFWLIPGGGLRDYLRYEVGAWLAGTAVLTAGGVFSALRLRRGDPGGRVHEVVLTCAATHLAFVTLFYGQRLSWIYYYALPVCGLAAMTGRGKPRWQSAAVGLVALLTLVGMKAKVQDTGRLWRDDVRVRVPGVGEVWASPAELDEWRKVRELAGESGPAAWLARTEGAAVLEPGLFLAPETLYLVPGHPRPAEVTRKARQIGRANTVVRVRPRGDPARGGYERWPEIADALREFNTVWEGEFYEVARRRSE